METDCMAVEKFLKFPIIAIPSAPIKMAIIFVIIDPARILIEIFAKFSLTALCRTFWLIYDKRDFNYYVFIT